ncbi:hypothetical protein [Aureimonas sp. AU40]|uniref:hypothetical protein n=1 Tax=Aureimonas sp. AU40 TaxID=1637747 RepID=UPI000781A17F|nr:hypothetical protein [Aureimonas sp. AU40]
MEPHKFAKFDPDNPLFQEKASEIMAQAVASMEWDMHAALMGVRADTMVRDFLATSRQGAEEEGMTEAETVEHLKAHVHEWTDDDMIAAKETFYGDSEIETEIRERIRAERRRREIVRECSENENFGMF